MYECKQEKINNFYFYFTTVLFILFFIFFFYKDYISNKYNNYNEIISFSDNVNSEVAFYNINNNTIGIVYYNLFKSTNKVGEEIIWRKYKASNEISLEQFNILLNNILELTNTENKLDENNIIKYGGETVTISTSKLEILIKLIDE